MEHRVEMKYHSCELIVKLSDGYVRIHCGCRGCFMSVNPQYTGSYIDVFCLCDLLLLTVAFLFFKIVFKLKDLL